MIVNDVGLFFSLFAKILFFNVIVGFLVRRVVESHEIFLHSTYEKKFVSLI